MVEVSPADPAAQLRLKIADLERRLAALETARRSGATTQHGGSFVVANGDGSPILEIGEYERDGDDFYGLRILDAAGNSVIETSDQHDGLRFPWFHQTWRPNFGGTLDAAGAAKTVTSGSFVSLWDILRYFPVHDALLLFVFIHSDAGTTGEIRLDSVLGNSAVHTINTGGAIKVLRFEWIHPLDVGGADIGSAGAGTQVNLSARRTGGAGNVTVYWPNPALWVNQASLVDPSTDGNPTEIA